jgi:hypothetical protein
MIIMILVRLTPFQKKDHYGSEMIIIMIIMIIVWLTPFQEKDHCGSESVKALEKME